MQHMTQKISLTDNERNEFNRYADACTAIGKPARARLLRWLADSKWPVELRIYDKCKTMYRAWLVFNQF